MGGSVLEEIKLKSGIGWTFLRPMLLMVLSLGLSDTVHLYVLSKQISCMI